jgi:hypothetical protein
MTDFEAGHAEKPVKNPESRELRENFLNKNVSLGGIKWGEIKVPAH